MQSVASFFRFLVGFMVFISISFGVTYAVQQYSTVKDESQHAAAAKAIMLEQDIKN